MTRAWLRETDSGENCAQVNARGDKRGGGEGEGRVKNIRSVFFWFDQGKFYNLTTV